MESKVRTKEAILAQFHDGQVIGIGGQANHGSPRRLIELLVESGAKDLTIVSLDSGDVDLTVGRLIHTGQVKKIITTHIGKNPETVGLYADGKLEVELNPMGSFIERIRCGGLGLGGVLTRTGLGTVVEENRKKVVSEGTEYLLEPAIRVDVALTRARRGDPTGNLSYRGTSGNSNPILVTAGDVSIVEVDQLMELGELTIDQITTPGLFVDMILE